MKLNWPWTIALVLLFILLGAMRQLVFDHVNAQIGLYTGKSLVFPLPAHMDYMSQFSLSQLSKAKWIFTFLFMLVNFGLSIVALKWALKRADFFKWLLTLYITGFVLAAVFFVGGKLFNLPKLGYTIARTIMGTLQSPFPLMVLIPASYLLPKAEEKQD